MNTNKGLALPYIILIVAIVGVVAVGVGYYVAQQGKAPVIEEKEKQLVGNDRDEHGCIPSAGYTWCEAKQKCLRLWEEKCEAEKPVTTSTTVSLDLSTEFARTYKTILSKELGEPVNFGNHYRIALIGCGSGCGYHKLLDKNTGKVYDTPADNDLSLYRNIEFSAGSSDFKIYYINGKTEIYNWNGASFIKL